MRASLPASTAARVGEPEYTDANGRRWRIGFDYSTSPPGVVFEAVTTWGYMKGLFATWGDVDAIAVDWGTAKTF